MGGGDGSSPSVFPYPTNFNGDEPPPPVVGAIPSVTELSRTSLLAGLLLRGRQDDERRLFPANPDRSLFLLKATGRVAQALLK